MNNFIKIDMENWDRAAFYKWYTEEWRSIYASATKKLDVTANIALCKEKGLKLVPALIYCTGLVINERECFRVGIKDDVLGHWDVLHPIYPVRNENANTYAFHTTKFTESFKDFYEGYIKEQESGIDTKGKMFAGYIPQNNFQISIMPITDFDSSTFSMGSYRYFYTPIVVMGKYAGKTKKTIPVSLTINHATVDGYDVGMFFTSLQYYLKNPDKWLK